MTRPLTDLCAKIWQATRQPKARPTIRDCKRIAA
ncbi:DUF3039 domain-containing protein [Puniceibacterium sp. IMCC21224]